MQRLTLALDAMGGDSGPPVVVPAAKQALENYPYLTLRLIGDREQLIPLIHHYHLEDETRLSIVHTVQMIAPEDKPLKILRTRRNSSMGLSLQMVADGEADACVSAGHTGALVALSHAILKVLPGIERPALVSSIPNRRGRQTLMLDLGANSTCSSHLLHQFALMGMVLVQTLWHINNPKIALLNIGSESIKGNDAIRQAGRLLTQTSSLNYQGFIEGNQIFDGDVDVIVSDGFSGNIALKTAEGTAEFLLYSFRKMLPQSPLKRFIMTWLMPNFQRQLSQLTPQKHNGACMLGLRGVVIKSHGRADSEAFFQAISEALVQSQLNIPQLIGQQIPKFLSEIG
ncbi:phosphate acyltransferase PlsX [Celerinatantimonas yamalensis]|uniref:Phosphate acyltransferase n=1 Tax=Celerinatantimonas yamalensis TaxID=559956 RepID=A0ABW9G3G9_9GAMM